VRQQKGYGDEHAAKARVMMLRYDADKSGDLTVNELEPEPNRGVISVDMMPLVDANGDQKIDFDELAKYLAKLGSDPCSSP